MAHWLPLPLAPRGIHPSFPKDIHMEAESERVCWLQGLACSEEDRWGEDAGTDNWGHPGSRAVPHAGLHPVLQLSAEWSSSATAED